MSLEPAGPFPDDCGQLPCVCPRMCESEGKRERAEDTKCKENTFSAPVCLPKLVELVGVSACVLLFPLFGAVLVFSAVVELIIKV